MASRIITDKVERLQYIKEVATRLKEEKLREKMIYETDTEVLEHFGHDVDFMSIENLDGLIHKGMQKIAGGLRKMPVIIL